MVENISINETYALKTSLKSYEKAHLLRILRLCNGNIQQTADLLEINRSGLYQKIKEHDIDLKRLQ